LTNRRASAVRNTLQSPSAIAARRPASVHRQVRSATPTTVREFLRHPRMRANRSAPLPTSQRGADRRLSVHHNPSRRHSALSYLSPIEYERKHDGLKQALISPDPSIKAAQLQPGLDPDDDPGCFAGLVQCRIDRDDDASHRRNRGVSSTDSEFSSGGSMRVPSTASWSGKRTAAPSSLGCRMWSRGSRRFALGP
jgi:hypothetical protein